MVRSIVMQCIRFYELLISVNLRVSTQTKMKTGFKKSAHLIEMGLFSPFFSTDPVQSYWILKTTFKKNEHIHDTEQHNKKEKRATTSMQKRKIKHFFFLQKHATAYWRGAAHAVSVETVTVHKTAGHYPDECMQTNMLHLLKTMLMMMMRGPHVCLQFSLTFNMHACVCGCGKYLIMLFFACLLMIISYINVITTIYPWQFFHQPHTILALRLRPINSYLKYNFHFILLT